VHMSEGNTQEAQFYNGYFYGIFLDKLIFFVTRGGAHALNAPPLDLPLSNAYTKGANLGFWMGGGGGVVALVKGEYTGNPIL